jgi:hypothetical protein
MPDAQTLDLTAEDITQASWDELTHAMLGGDQHAEAGSFDTCTTPLPPCGTCGTPASCQGACTTCSSCFGAR